MSDAARRHWRVVVKQLSSAGVMTRLDTDALAAYCESYAMWVDAQDKISKFGPVIKAGDGTPKLSPYMRVATQAFTQMKQLLSEFGMTPAARTRVATAEKAADKSDPWAEL